MGQDFLDIQKISLVTQQFSFAQKSYEMIKCLYYYYFTNLLSFSSLLAIIMYKRIVLVI